MRKRDASTAPSVGDRVAYVIVRGAKDSKLHERVGMNVCESVMRKRRFFLLAFLFYFRKLSKYFSQFFFSFSLQEDPLYVLENDIPLDAPYYVENQLTKPLGRLFKSILSDTKVLFEGAHMRSIIKVMKSCFFF